MKSLLILVVLLGLQACSYNIRLYVTKNVGVGCSSTVAGGGMSDVDAAGSGSVSGGEAEMLRQLAGSVATDDTCAGVK